MFGNWLSLSEAFHVLRRLRHDSFLRNRVLSKLRLKSDDRIRASWSHTDAPETNWWDIPAVRTRWNKMMTGSSDKTLQSYVAETYLRGGSPLRGLSLGCGGGANEILWARTGRFSSIDAYDLSEQRIRAAIASLHSTPEEGLIHYRVGNIGLLALPETSYDVVIFEQSLHHLTPLDRVLPRIKSFLRPGGFLVANEFVGPTRFQWTDRQLSAVNALLTIFPRKYTLLSESQYPKLKSIRPSKISMWLSDPSEAVESSNIIPMLQRHFRKVNVNGYGGTVLHLLFAGIGHHFVHPDPVAEKLLDLSFEVEDVLLKSGELPHDFALVVCQK